MHTEEAKCCFSEEVCRAPDGILQPHVAETTAEKTAFFSCIVIACGGGESNLKGLLWSLNQQRSKQQRDLCPRVQSRLCASEETNTLPAGFVGSPINGCYC